LFTLSSECGRREGPSVETTQDESRDTGLLAGQHLRAGGPRQRGPRPLGASPPRRHRGVDETGV